MATSYKILGQQAPAELSEATVYTVPTSASSVISSIVICNRGSSAGTFRIATSQGGGATASKDYLYYDQPLSQNNTFIATIGITLGASDKLKCYASTANFTFQAFGSETT